MSEGPSKSEIQEIFRRLRNLTSNRVCFDCNAKNPTWASITYGVFICIDCSAVHRSLGVHLSFVRSTQLDTTWTWIQLRNMQIGGNANASAFFSQHHCTSNDSQQKYNSRAAQLYREKLNQIVAKYNKIHGNKIDFEKEDGGGDTPTEKDADFFEEMNLTHTAIETLTLDNSARLTKQENGNKLNKEGPNVEGVLNESSPSISTISGGSSSSRKPTIGQRKTLGGAKKGGMGAQKVKADFSEIEKEASMLDQMRERQEEEAKLDVERRVVNEEKQAATMRLAYQDLSKQQKQREQQLLKMDPKKAEQVERLGMGIGVRSGVSHSAISDMMTIDQENPSSKSSKSSRRNNDSFFDEFEIVENSIHSSIGAGFSNKRLDDWELIGSSNNNGSGNSSSSRNKSIVDERDDILSTPRRPVVAPGSPGTDEAQKKFGGAKAISSDQYFGSRDNEYERRSNISRFEGQKSISSADYFGDGQQTNQPASYSALQNVDLDDVKESVRQGVTKVAGKLSNLANGMMSSIQEKYGY